MTRLIKWMLGLNLVITCQAANAQGGVAPVNRPALDVVFALDISGSMKPIAIEAKRMIKSLISSAGASQSPVYLRVGLIRYGDGERNLGVLPLTDNASDVFAFIDRTGTVGKDESVGRFVEIAVTQMNWSRDPRTFKMLYMVGNESADQGEVHFSRTVPLAAARGITVNAIECIMGQVSVDDNDGSWRELARLGQGYYFVLAARNGRMVNVTSHFAAKAAERDPLRLDRQIDRVFEAQVREIEKRLKSTIVAYRLNGTSARPVGLAEQLMRDVNKQWGGIGLGDELLEEQATPTIDLTNMVQRPGFDVGQLDPRGLPLELQRMSVPELHGYLVQMVQIRARLRQQMHELHIMRLRNKMQLTQPGR